jgi:dipeptidyl aminopeptidase/acylaminoacyl peptidase
MRRLMVSMLSLLFAMPASVAARPLIYSVFEGVPGHIDGPFDVLVDDAGAGAQRKIISCDAETLPRPTGPCLFSDVALSPDGQTIALTDIDRLALAGVEGTNLHFVPGVTGVQHPSWSPDGARLAVAATSAAGSAPTIVVMRADGTERRRLTRVGPVDHGPWWGPDGRIAYVPAPRCRALRCLRPGVWTSDSRGRNRQRLIRHNAHDFAWAPSGTRIAWVYGESLWVADGHGRHARRVLTDTQGFGRIAWSPSAHRIAVVHGCEEPYGCAQLDLANPRTGALTMVAHNFITGLSW